jgi:hypothetical protein
VCRWCVCRVGVGGGGWRWWWWGGGHTADAIPMVSLASRGCAHASSVRLCAGDSAGTTATVASDVYMLGGLLYELLTAGHVPYHWLLRDVKLAIERRRSSVPVAIPFSKGATAEGLLGKSMVQAAEVDDVALPWNVQIAATASSPDAEARLAEAIALIEGCCKLEPSARLKLEDLSRALESLHTREVAARRGAAFAPSPSTPRDSGVPAVSSLLGSITAGEEGERKEGATRYTCLQVRSALSVNICYEP